MQPPDPDEVESVRFRERHEEENMKKSRILAGIWMLFLVLAYLVSASITIGIAAVATVLLCFFCFFLSIAMKNKVTCYFEVPDMAEKEQQVYGKLIFENHSRQDA